MFLTGFEYFKPSSLEEASELLSKYGGKAKVFNGGTDLLVRMRERLIVPEALIDIKSIPGMKDIRQLDGGEMFIGAAVTMNQLIESSTIIDKYYILAEAAHTVASYQLRNRATLTGNLCNASPSGDTLPALFVLGARVQIFGSEGFRELPVEDFILGVRKIALNSGELVTGIILPRLEGKCQGTYYKHSRRKDVDLATVGTAVLCHNNKWTICYAAVAPKPLRGLAAEELLNRLEAFTEKDLEEVLEAAAREVTPITDVRGTKDYRTEMVRISLKRAILKVAEDLKQVKMGG